MITAIDLVTILFEFMEAHPTTSWDNLHEAPPPIPISKADEIRGATTDTAASIAAPPLVPIKANYGDVPEEPDGTTQYVIIGVA